MKKQAKKLLPKQMLRYFTFFYRYLGESIFYALVASMFVALLDGIGLTMFIPLLKVTDSSANAADAGADMGDMAIVTDTIEAVGVSLTTTNVLLIMLVFFSLKGVAKFFADYYLVILRQRFANKVRLRNMELLAGYDYRAFSTADSGKIQNTFSGEVERLNGAFRSYFSMMQYGIMTCVYVMMAYIANPRFALIVAIGGILSNVAFSKIYQITKKASRQITSKTHSFQGYLIQSVTSFKFLKATNLIQAYKKRVDETILGVEMEQRRVGTMNSVATAIREPIIMGIVVLAILIQIKVFGGVLGTIILSLLFFYRGLSFLVAVQNYYNTFLGTSGSIENMESFVADLELNQEITGSKTIEKLNHSVVLNNLSYSYEDYDLLQEVNLSIRKNETVGIVGESGTGKTTLVNIMCGLLKVSPGMLLIDGKDIMDVDAYTLRDRIGYVTQEAQVFSDTIYNNVSFWKERTKESEREVWRALKLAHAEQFVRALPKQLDSVIGINGVNLSGGQRQRISIARELYRDIDILVLDEATSALDSQSENLIQENIESLSGSYTMIVIAHRLSTIRKADKILYLKPGGSYEIGTFDDLFKTSATFQNMVALQAIG
ncbi:ABC transporter ATP-binding protein [Neolewinella litorea]|uniref:ABC transporter ATP-binding protein n=1 Tax=Neolewinella litorea TaxID=2562452 RepID=A0A4S4NIH7_9BACT|nr:ABC transporter ATP-binding protein [Neolewinella litorea]THH39509.1 ABC transporter ATP-binding protein [Neolewinella litorea]